MLSTDTSNNEQQPSSSSSSADGNGSNRSNGTDQAPEKFTAPAITTVSTTSMLSPDPILVTRSSSGGHHRGHHSHSKRSIGSAAEILSSLKITTSGHHHEHSTPTSPIPSSTLDSHVISGNMDDFTIKAPIGKVLLDLCNFRASCGQSIHVGYGSSAVVYSAVYTPLNLRVALKMIDLDKFERNQIDELRVSKR